MGLRGRAPVLNWRSIVAEKPPQQPPGEQLRWRNLAAQAIEIQRALHHLMAAVALDTGDDGADGCPERGDDDIDDHDECPFGDHVATADDMLKEMLNELDSVYGLDACANAGPVAELFDVVRAAMLGAERVGVAIAARSAGDIGWGQDQVNNLLDRLAEVRSAINVEVVKATGNERAADIDAWRRWVAHNIDVGARNAHRYLALPEEWQPTSRMAPDGCLASSPIRLLDTYRSKYDGLWNRGACRAVNATPKDSGGGSRLPWHDRTVREAFPRSTPSQLREASLTFRERTLVAFDGVAMRHYALLSDDALEVLADFVLVIEYLGHLPQQLHFTAMPLIAKARGGHRAIASLASLYRLWSRLRREETRKWEAAHDRPYLAAGKGRGPQDAVWRQAARAESANGSRRQVATALWDVSSFFETCEWPSTRTRRPARCRSVEPLPDHWRLTTGCSPAAASR